MLKELERSVARFYLQLVDAIANRDQLVGAPNKAFHLYRLYGLQHSGHVGLVVPRLNVEQD